MFKLGKWLRSGGLSGGIVLPPQLLAPRVARVEALPVPDSLCVPLRDFGGGVPEAIVEAGQVVQRGQPLAVCAARAGPAVHAPASGRVTGLRRVVSLAGGEVPGIEIAVDESAAAASGPGQPVALNDAAAAQAEFCDRFGLVYGEAGRALSELFCGEPAPRLDDLIISAVAAEPAETAQLAALLWGGSLLVEAAAQLGQALQVKRTWMALTERFVQGRELLGQYARRFDVRVAVLPERYPQGAVPLLVRSITGREMRLGGAPREVGAAVVDAVGLCGWLQARAYGRAMTHVVVTVQGDAAARRVDYEVPIGTSVGQLISAVEAGRPIARVLDGGPLRGRALRDRWAVVDKTTRCLTLLSHRMIGEREPGACIRCGWCVDDCPVGLDPAALMNLAELNEAGRAALLHPQACVECGICSYICPAHLDLMESVRTLRRRLVQAEGGR